MHVRADAAPRHAEAGRGELFRAYLVGRPAVYTIAFGGGGAFVVGAWRQSPLIMAAAPACVVLLVAVIAFVVADRTAADRFYLHFAASLGLLHGRRLQLTPFTPLLGAGDRRRCEHWMQGRLPGKLALAGGLGHFAWEEERHDSDGDGSLSKAITLMYSVPLPTSMRTSVFSMAGAHSIGSCCVNVAYGCTVCNTASFTLPSITGGSAESASLPTVKAGGGGCWAETMAGMTEAAKRSPSSATASRSAWPI